jgi:proteasome accessory factor C
VPESTRDRLRRLLLLVPYVIDHPDVTVDEVCEKFGIDRRRLASDLNLLFLCGRPGYGPGELIEAFILGDHIHIRMAEYFSKPLRLTAGEALMLHAAGRALVAAGSADEALGRALEKLEEALGERAPSGAVTIDFAGSENLDKIREALDKKRRVHLIYRSHAKEEETRRDVDPWMLLAGGGLWYLVGWCHRANDVRTFRLDRVRTAHLLDSEADVPEDLDPSQFSHVYARGPGSTEVTIEVAPRAASWIEDYYPLESRQEQPDGWMRLTLAVGGLAWVERLLMRLGSQARVVEPEELARKVKDTACRLAERYR